MAIIKIISETPISKVALKEKLDKIIKRDKELTPRAQKTKEFLDVFVKLKSKEEEEIMKKLNDLNIPRIKERHLIKIIDIMPKDVDSLKAVLSGENITLKQEDFARIVEVLKKH